MDLIATKTYSGTPADMDLWANQIIADINEQLDTEFGGINVTMTALTSGMAEQFATEISSTAVGFIKGSLWTIPGGQMVIWFTGDAGDGYYRLAYRFGASDWVGAYYESLHRGAEIVEADLDPLSPVRKTFSRVCGMGTSMQIWFGRFTDGTYVLAFYESNDSGANVVPIEAIALVDADIAYTGPDLRKELIIGSAFYSSLGLIPLGYNDGIYHTMIPKSVYTAYSLTLRGADQGTITDTDTGAASADFAAALELTGYSSEAVTVDLPNDEPTATATILSDGEVVVDQVVCDALCPNYAIEPGVAYKVILSKPGKADVLYEGTAGAAGATIDATTPVWEDPTEKTITITATKDSVLIPNVLAYKAYGPGILSGIYKQAIGLLPQNITITKDQDLQMYLEGWSYYQIDFSEVEDGGTVDVGSVVDAAQGVAPSLNSISFINTSSTKLSSFKSIVSGNETDLGRAWPVTYTFITDEDAIYQTQFVMQRESDSKYATFTLHPSDVSDGAVVDLAVMMNGIEWTEEEPDNDWLGSMWTDLEAYLASFLAAAGVNKTGLITVLAIMVGLGILASQLS
jgi:hypothetical protein